MKAKNQHKIGLMMTPRKLAMLEENYTNFLMEVGASIGEVDILCSVILVYRSIIPTPSKQNRDIITRKVAKMIRDEPFLKVTMNRVFG